MREFMNLINEAVENAQKDAVLKDGTPVRVEIGPHPNHLDNDRIVLVAVYTVRDHEWTGSGSFGENDGGLWHTMKPGTWTAYDLWVNEEWRRQGVATLIYDTMEEAGMKTVPEGRPGKLKPNGRAFWDNRRIREDVVEFPGTMPDEFNSLKDFLSDPRPTSEMIQAGDVVTFGDAVFDVLNASRSRLLLRPRDGGEDRIVAAKDVEPAPFELWNTNGHG
jgi:GNAT superfamily N-acetyltransferase